MQESNADIPETEEELISKAQFAVSQCNWMVGDCAAKWTTKYARGRTDADFANLVGLSTDQVYQRRRVWETFGDVRDDYSQLKWSHFYVALNWDDAPECLNWASENDATVAEMRAWRRMQHGEDLTQDADEFDESLVSYLPTEPTLVRDPGSGQEGGKLSGGENDGPMRNEPGNLSTVSGVAREAGEAGTEDSDYAPYRQGAAQPGPGGEGTAVAEPSTSVEQVVKRITTSLERCNSLLTPDFVNKLQSLPEKTRKRFLSAAGEFTTKVEELL